jgi:DNA polymerase-3 subunit alpha
LAGIVSDLRLTSNARGRVGLFKLDDGSEAIDAVVNEEVLDAVKDLLKDDALVIVQGKVQLDRFSGGVRLTVVNLMDLPAARCRHGKYLRVPVNGNRVSQPPPVGALVKAHPAKRVETEHGDLRQGLAVRLWVQRVNGDGLGAEGEVDLGDDAKFFPSDEALAQWRAAIGEPGLEVVYG